MPGKVEKEAERRETPRIRLYQPRAGQMFGQDHSSSLSCISVYSHGSEDKSLELQHGCRCYLMMDDEKECKQEVLHTSAKYTAFTKMVVCCGVGRLHFLRLQHATRRVF